ncbi:MAG: DUF4142 domain-containing protein [Oligoflexales bacterium]
MKFKSHQKFMNVSKWTVCLLAGMSASVLFANMPSNGASTPPLPTSPKSQLKAPSQDFAALQKIQMINAAEIKVGQLALEKSPSTQIKLYADMLLREHTQSKNGFANLDLGNQAPYSLGQEASDFQIELDKSYARLKEVKREQFDLAFIEEMVSGHQKAVDVAGQLRSQGFSQPINTYLNEFNIMVSRHLDQAKDLQRGAVAH